MNISADGISSAIKGHGLTPNQSHRKALEAEQARETVAGPTPESKQLANELRPAIGRDGKRPTNMVTQERESEYRRGRVASRELTKDSEEIEIDQRIRFNQSVSDALNET